jgi:hypothetical protein
MCEPLKAAITSDFSSMQTHPRDMHSPLHTLIEKRGAVSLLVDRDTEHLPSAVRLRLNDGDVELVRVLRERVRAGHARGTGADDEHALLAGFG